MADDVGPSPLIVTTPYARTLTSAVLEWRKDNPSSQNPAPGDEVFAVTLDLMGCIARHEVSNRDIARLYKVRPCKLV